jgi:tetratricopeptide (TPR) repeat protein
VSSAPATVPAPAATAELQRQQLDRIAASKTFQRVDRLRRFLTFIVEETLAGRGDQLKEFVIGVAVFDKTNAFDPRNDPLVRVQARRLRARLERYYREEAQPGELVLDLPKGGYAPVFRASPRAVPARSPAAALARRNAVLVLPFSDDTPSGDQAAFCRGLAQEIAHTLAGAEGIRVALAAVAGDDRGDVAARIEQTRAATLVGGGVRRHGDALRITTYLADAASGCHLWSMSADRPLADAVAAQEAVAAAVLAQLRETAGPARQRHPTENLTAYNFYLQGRHLLTQRTEEGMRRAVEAFERAIAEDPRYAEAYSGLADTYGLLAHYGVLPPAEAWAKTASNAAWAVLLDDSSVEAHTSLAHVKATQDWDWQGSEQAFQRALALDPRYSTAHHWFAISCLVPMGRLDEALEELGLAQAADPISPIVSRDLAKIHYFQGDFETALECCDHTIEQHPYFSPAYWMLGLVQEQLGDFDEATAALQRALQLSPDTPQMLAAIARIHASAGRPGEARALLARLLAMAEQRYVSPFDLALLHFALGDDEPAFACLEQAFQDRCHELVFMQLDPRFSGALKRSPRFAALVHRLGLPQA